ncbi:MAG: nitroreductase family protein [Nanoarchaeota archaeon]
MKPLEMLKTRRSIRNFKQKSVPKEILDEILDCAMQAPSAVNAQPWHFIVVKDQGLLKRVSEVHPYAKMAKDSAAAIIVCAEPQKEKIAGFFPQDCSAATQNILLAAHFNNLGAVWCGIYPNEELMKKFCKLFDIPESIIPFSIVPLGYTDEKTGKVDRFKKDKVHYNTW